MFLEIARSGTRDPYKVMKTGNAALLALLLAGGCAAPPAAPWPRALVVPQPDEQLSFQVGGREVLRYHYGPGTPKPYFYPVIGPAGLPVTRITHPRDPHTHDHHLSLWIGHQNVAGLNFWEHRRSPARIVHDHLVKLEDGDAARAVVRARWLDGDRKPVLLDERTWTLTPREGGEFTLDLELKLGAAAGPVTIGKSHFGLIAVRVAKYMGTIDGGGRITNSEGRVDEKELMPHRRARWCDYSGPVAPGAIDGIALLDHPSNPNHPTYFHVRGDGWMGSSFSEEADVVVSKERPLVLRYRLWVHRGPADPAAIDREWKTFAGGV
jgi:hypothetical protein